MLNQPGMSWHSLSTVGHSDAATWPIGGFPVDHKALATPILERPVFERLLFSQCWEDPRMDAESLCLKPGKTALVVTSGGCTALSLALLGPDSRRRSHSGRDHGALRISGENAGVHLRSSFRFCSFGCSGFPPSGPRLIRACWLCFAGHRSRTRSLHIGSRDSRLLLTTSVLQPWCRP